MISLDLKQKIRLGYDPYGSLDKLKSWIYDPDGSKIRIRGIRSQIRFLGSMHMSGYSYISITSNTGLTASNTNPI